MAFHENVGTARKPRHPHYHLMTANRVEALEKQLEESPDIKLFTGLIQLIHQQ